jgi:7,8-dihydropterin-6-yl-methyl-4-(beta-D-ribofuranosyl)aminobenzene 5'-phosphate synthase
VKIITLIENLTYGSGLAAEHGLSMYIESENKKILFDTGQSGMFLNNAKKLGINIEEIDLVVLSHGHYDHTGGLYPFLEANKKATVYCKESLFEPRYNGKTRFIGTQYIPEILINRLQFAKEIIEIDNNVFIIPNIEIFNPIDTHFKGLNKKINGSFIEDNFTDELFLVIKQPDSLHIVTACSHRGITNICKTAQETFNLPIKSIVGGFHLKDCRIEQYVEITWYLRQLNLQSIGVCHCTGIDKYAGMREECDTHVFYNFTGNEVNFT